MTRAWRYKSSASGQLQWRKSYSIWPSTSAWRFDVTNSVESSFHDSLQSHARAQLAYGRVAICVWLSPADWPRLLNKSCKISFNGRTVFEKRRFCLSHLFAARADDVWSFRLVNCCKLSRCWRVKTISLDQVSVYICSRAHRSEPTAFASCVFGIRLKYFGSTYENRHQFPHYLHGNLTLDVLLLCIEHNTS